MQTRLPVRDAQARHLKIVTHASLSYLIHLADLLGDAGGPGSPMLSAFSWLRAAPASPHPLDPQDCPGLTDLLTETIRTCWGEDRAQVEELSAALFAGPGGDARDAARQLGAAGWGSLARTLTRVTLRESLYREALQSDDPLGALLSIDGWGVVESTQLLSEVRALRQLTGDAMSVREWFTQVPRETRQWADVGLARLALHGMVVAGETAEVLAQGYQAALGGGGQVDSRAVLTRLDGELAALRASLHAAVTARYPTWLSEHHQN